MIIFKDLFQAKSLVIVLMLGVLTGCIDEKKTNTDEVSYTPETRKLGVVAGEGADYSPGSQVTLTGRLTGTVSSETILWKQIEGTPVQGVASWTTPTLTFKAPVVDGIEALKFQISARTPAGAVINDADGKPLVDEVSINVFDPSILVTLEVENTTFAQLNGATLVGQGNGSYINGATGTHTADITPGASVKFKIPSGSKLGDKTLNAGFYTLYVQYAIPTSYGGKVGQATVNGVTSDMSFTASSAWEKFRVGTIKLNEGDNTIEIGGGWNYYRIDSISLIPAPAPAKPLAVSPALIDANATAATKDLMAFLVSNYGTKTLSGQTEYMDYSDAAKTGLREFNKVVEVTGGDAPAITAFDFIDYSSSRVACGAKPGTLSEDMITAHKQKNVILAPLWHWNAPTKLKDTTCSGSGETAWWSGFYSTGTTFDLKAALANPTGADYLALMADIDKISLQLKKFADADIPLLWRPLHEAQGAWFWWGKSGPDELKALWKIMHDRMTNDHGLHNLIWVFTYSGTADAAWYPGDTYVDIVGYDGYDGKNADNPFKSQFSTIKGRHDGKKLVGLTETGTIPNIALMQTENAWWAFFVTWNSTGSTEYGPANANPAVVKASYANAATLNLDDVPGGRAKVEAGLFDGFESSTEGFETQVDWAGTTGITTSSDWGSSGTTSLAFKKDLVALGKSQNIVFQKYFDKGLDVKGMKTMTITVNAKNAGANVNAHIFWKATDKESWPDAVAVPAEGVKLTIPLTVDSLNGFGVRFNGVDATSTTAAFYIDEVTVTDGTNSTVLYDFEPATDGFESQVSWGGVGGITTSSEWSKTGARSLALYKNLVTLGKASDVVFQTYPAKGLDLGGAKTMTIAAHAIGAGNAVNAHIFYKATGSESWPDAVAVGPTGVELSIDLSKVTSLNGFGVRFNGVDATSTNARFFIDSIKLDGKVIYDFEGTGAWEFQVKWTGTTGIHLATDWTKSGKYALAGVTQLKSGDDDVILQTYPAGGVLLGNVTKLKIAAHAADVGTAAQAQLFAKDKGGNWKDGGAVALVNGSANLTLDISEWDELSGFGVRFMGPVNSATESKYYLDDVTFE